MAITEGERELTEGQRELTERQSELTAGQSELTEEQRELTEVQRELPEGQRELSEGQRELTCTYVSLLLTVSNICPLFNLNLNFYRFTLHFDINKFHTSTNALFIIYLLTYLLSPRCRVLLEKLTDLQLVKKFPAIHGTRRFITALTSVRHLSLSWASPNQSI